MLAMLVASIFSAAGERAGVGVGLGTGVAVGVGLGIGVGVGVGLVCVEPPGDANELFPVFSKSNADLLNRFC